MESEDGTGGRRPLLGDVDCHPPISFNRQKLLLDTPLNDVSNGSSFYFPKKKLAVFTPSVSFYIFLIKFLLFLLYCNLTGHFLATGSLGSNGCSSLLYCCNLTLGCYCSHLLIRAGPLHSISAVLRCQGSL